MVSLYAINPPVLFYVNLEHMPCHLASQVLSNLIISLMVDQVLRLNSLGVGPRIISSSSAVDKSFLASEAEIKLGS